MTSSSKKKTLWAWAVGTFFGAGLLRPGPGTWGSAAACVLWFAAGIALRLSASALAWTTAGAAIAVILIGVEAGGIVERESGRADPGHVVVDEVAGQWIALIHTPLSLSHTLAAFLLFRLFDIVKPWPVRKLERLPGGWGIMLDDAAAGIYALLVLWVIGTWIGR